MTVRANCKNASGKPIPPIGSDAWARNYHDGTLKEKALRANPPDRLTSTELAESFVPNPASQNLPVELFGVPGYFWECLACGEVINSLPGVAARCQCGNITIDPVDRLRLFAKSDRVRLVTLIGRGSACASRVQQRTSRCT